MIDVLIILLIFLLLTSTFDPLLRLSVQLPKAGSGEALPAETPIRVAIRAEGHYDLAGEAIERNQTQALVDALRKAAGDKNDPLILIDADQNSNHQALVVLLDALSHLNFRRIGFSTQKDPKAKPSLTPPQRP